MRAAAVIVVAIALFVPGLGTVAGHHSPTHPILHRLGTAPGWSLDAFTAPHELISFSIGVGFDGEFAAQLVHLYNGQGALVTGFLVTYEAGRDPDVMVTAGSVRVEQEIVASNASKYPVTAFSIRCNAACSANRDFRALAVSAGDVDLWGYAIFSPSAVASNSTRNGTSVGAMPTTAFDGVAADVTLGYYGVVASGLSARSITTVDGMVGAFGKPSLAPAAASSVQGPTGSRQCFCVFQDDPAGTYSFSYTDADALATPGVLIWADVDL